jgi:hypothetical protein
MPGIDFDVVRQRVSMAEVLRLLEFVPTRVRGDQMRGPCPVHGSTSGRSCSFSVNVQRSRYQCFRCVAHVEMPWSSGQPSGSSASMPLRRSCARDWESKYLGLNVGDARKKFER